RLAVIHPVGANQVPGNQHPDNQRHQAECDHSVAEDAGAAAAVGFGVIELGLQCGEAVHRRYHAVDADHGHPTGHAGKDITDVCHDNVEIFVRWTEHRADEHVDHAEPCRAEQESTVAHYPLNGFKQLVVPVTGKFEAHVGQHVAKCRRCDVEGEHRGGNDYAEQPGCSKEE